MSAPNTVKWAKPMTLNNGVITLKPHCSHALSTMFLVKILKLHCTLVLAWERKPVPGYIYIFISGTIFSGISFGYLKVVLIHSQS